jgi:hypothetical protein
MLGRERSGTEAAVSDAPENANEEFGRGDQEFGGGPGEVEYGEQRVPVGEDGTVVDDNQRRERETIVMDDEKEGVALPGTDEDDLVMRDTVRDQAKRSEEE